MQGDDHKAYQVVLDHTEVSLLNGGYKVGAKLPPECDLAEELGVSRGTVRKAIRMLQAQRILESHPGPGRSTRIIAGHTMTPGRLFRLHLALSSTSVLDLTNTQVALGRSTAMLASRHWDDEALNELGDLVDRMDREITLDKSNALGTGLHVGAVLTAHNPFIGDLSSAIRQAMRALIRDVSVAVDDWQALRNVLCKQHRQIFEAIEKCGRDLAVVLTEEHIQTVYQALKLGI